MNILLAGFADNESGSKLLLDLVSPRHYIDKQYIDVRKEQWKEELLSRMKRKSYEYLFLVHMKQQPEDEENQVELVLAADGGRYKTTVDYHFLQEKLFENEFLVKLVEDTDEQDADALYKEVLTWQEENQIKTECLLINIPQVTRIDVMLLSKQMTKYFEALVKAR